MARGITTQNPGRVLRSTRNSKVHKPTKSRNPTNNGNALARVRLRKTVVQNQDPNPRTPKSKSKNPLPSYLIWSESNVLTDPNRHTWLFDFPVEIVQRVASFLPLESTVCLTLSCKLALHILGTTSWTTDSIRKRWHRDPDSGEVHRTHLIELLSRDVKDLGIKSCTRCNTLHPPLKKPNEHQYTPLTKYCWGQNAVIDYLPQGLNGTGYGLVLEHIKHVLNSTLPDSSSPIEYLSGWYQAPNPRFHYSISSSGRYVNRNIIIQRDHIFQPLSAKTSVRVEDILNLPLRICPHQSTTIEEPPESRYLSDNRRNGPLLTWTVITAFPLSKRPRVLKSGGFRDPTALEQRMMSEADRGLDVTYRCRSCATKWRVEYGPNSNSGGLRISVFHCFYKELYTASVAWTHLVRREGRLLGKDKRNSEFWSRSKSSPDFRID
ncbi:hypothetical protein F4810DRAFT_672092 [Camillea tinctor]|nr:hypothetical protein F4810DRAFT_672092 [Camillea tinctor]